MNEPTFRQVELYDGQHQTTFIEDMRKACAKHVDKEIQLKGVFIQFRTDWIMDGLSYALRQTLRYVGYGYRDKMIFYDLGAVVGKMLLTIKGEF